MIHFILVYSDFLTSGEASCPNSMHCEKASSLHRTLQSMLFNIYRLLDSIFTQLMAYALFARLNVLYAQKINLN